MNKYTSLLIIYFIMVTGCNKLRIRDIPQESDSPRISAYHTSQINYQRNAVSSEELAPPLTEEWDESLNSLPSRGFTIIDDWMFFGTSDGYLAAAHMSDGDMSGKRNLGDACPAPPTIWQSMIYQPFEAGKYGLVAYDVHEGGAVWQLNDLFSTSSPVIINNRLFHQTTYGMIYCLNHLSGILIWQKYLNQPVRNSLALSDQILISGSMDGRVTALDYMTGATIWETELNNPIFADPVISDESVYIVDYTGYLYAIDINTGEILNSKKFGVALYHGPSVDNRKIYLGLSNGSLIVLDATTFAVLNSFKGEGPVSGSPLVTNSYVYYATLSKFLYILDKNNLRLLQDLEFDARLRSTPIIKNGKLVIACEDKRAIALSKAE